MCADFRFQIYRVFEAQFLFKPGVSSCSSQENRSLQKEGNKTILGPLFPSSLF